MALAFYFAPTAFSAQQYNECITLLKKAGAGHPTGRVYHACFGPKDRLSVFDVWTSQAAFEKFGKTLLPIMNQLGTDPGQPMVAEVHNVIVRPKSRPRAAAKKAAPVKRAASKKAGKARGRKGKKR